MGDAEVKQLLRRTESRRWLLFGRPLSRRMEAARALAALVEQSEEANAALEQVWKATLREGNHAVLHALIAGFGECDPARWAAPLVGALDLRAANASIPSVRDAAIQVLKRLGKTVIPELVNRLLVPPEEGARWALYTLREIGLTAAANALRTAYAKADECGGETLVIRLAHLRNESWEDLISLLAALGRLLPLDRRLLDALARECGSREIESRSLQFWHRARSSDARDLLVRYFAHDTTVFGGPA